MNVTIITFPICRNFLFTPILYPIFQYFTMQRFPILSRILLLALAGILIWSTIVTGRSIFSYMQIQEDIEQEKEEVVKLQNEISELVSKLQGGDDARALELEARRRLNVKLPNEEVVIIIPGDEEAIIEEAMRALNVLDIEEKQGFLSRIMGWFQNGLK